MSQCDQQTIDVNEAITTEVPVATPPSPDSIGKTSLPCIPAKRKSILRSDRVSRPQWSAAEKRAVTEAMFSKYTETSGAGKPPLYAYSKLETYVSTMKDQWDSTNEVLSDEELGREFEERLATFSNLRKQFPYGKAKTLKFRSLHRRQFWSALDKAHTMVKGRKDKDMLFQIQVL
jgi:hypothetical protein